MKPIDRIIRMRQGLPSQEEWEKMENKVREERVISIFDEDAQTFDSALGYEIYIKANESLEASRTYLNEFTYEQLMLTFDLAEKFARNWTFA